MSPVSQRLTASASLLLFAGLAHAHIGVVSPESFGFSKHDYSLQTPLDSTTPDWFCRGQDASTAESVLELVAGKSVTVSLGCSPDSYESGQSCQDGGGSLHSFQGSRMGCGLSISYKNGVDPSGQTAADLKVFSVLYDCVEENSKHTFQIPDDLPASDGEVLCSWGWIPDERASADEMYMTCMPCTVKSSTTGTIAASQKSMLVWGVPDPGVDLPSSRPYYHNEFKDGAQKLTIEGAKSSSSSGSTKKPSAAKAKVTTAAAAADATTSSDEPSSTVSPSPSPASSSKNSKSRQAAAKLSSSKSKSKSSSKDTACEAAPARHRRTRKTKQRRRGTIAALAYPAGVQPARMSRERRV